MDDKTREALLPIYKKLEALEQEVARVADPVWEVVLFFEGGGTYEEAIKKWDIDDITLAKGYLCVSEAREDLEILTDSLIESRRRPGRMLKEGKGNVINNINVEILDMDLDDPDKDFEVVADFDIGGEYDNVEDVMVKAAGRVMACNKSSIYHCEIAALDGDSGQEIPLKNVMDNPGSYEVDIFRRHSGNREYRINIFFDVE